MQGRLARSRTSSCLPTASITHFLSAAFASSKSSHLGSGIGPLAVSSSARTTQYRVWGSGSIW